MSSSDDEGETVPRSVSDYEFNDENGPISFGKLPIQWRDSVSDGKSRKIFLKGKTDDGLLSLYKEVKAWKFDLSCQILDISVLSVEGHWIKLLKPRKAFEDIIRTILITVQCLHFLKRNPETTRKNLWEHLAKRFRFDSKPAEDDLVDHIPLIREAVQRDEILANSKFLSAFLKEKPKKRRAFNEDTGPSFIVDDVSGNEDQKADASESEEVDENDCFDSVCAICDNGGHIYLCEGKCMRSFHATEEDGQESKCYSLRFSEEEIEALQNVDFYCKNCEYKQHQCFSCGELGSSDESSGAEVFRCINGACGNFFHADCVAKLLHPKDKAAAEEHSKKITAGEQFACPVHKCCVCNELEVRSDHHLQFAICRRCPRAYHRKCLPREIAFDKDDEDSDTVPRAWENLIPNRILIYCLDHVIDERFITPLRNHIKFPGPQKKKSKLQIETTEMPFTSEDTPGRGANAKPSEVQKMSSDSLKGDFSRNILQKVQEPGLIQKKKSDVSRKSLGYSNKSRNVEGKISLGDKLYDAMFGRDSELAKADREQRVRTEHVTTQKTQNRVPSPKRINNAVSLDDDSKKRILTLMKEASSSITLEEVKARYKAPSTHYNSSKQDIRNVTSGKVEGSVQALRTALETLEKGGSVQDAQAVCGIDLLVQVMKWRERLKVYLAPFLYGMRYTSFGRHFTKLDKLQEIVDMLHCYIQDGDMMVDFCCGSNDFSVLLKKKLDEVRKTCSFKNYDILQAKDDFCFERRDWMDVKPDELPEGSRLIMGLNPPFGVNAALANKFINKALQFKPKLLILIVPRETERLDEKRSRYNLIWEDDQMLAGKAFYLPGSVDVNEKQIEDWNVNAPVLYLWSSPEWTQKHKAIAEQHGHPGSRSNCKLEDNHMIQAPSKSELLHNLDKFQKQVEDEHPNDEVNQNKGYPEISSHQESLLLNIEAKNNHVPSSNHSTMNVKHSSGKRRKKRKRSAEKKALEEISAHKRPAPDHSTKGSSPGPVAATKHPAPGHSTKGSSPGPVSATKCPAPDHSTKGGSPGSVSATKRPAPTKVMSPGQYPSNHFQKQSPHVHSGGERSMSVYESPKWTVETHSSIYCRERESSYVPKRNDDYQPVDHSRSFPAYPSHSQSDDHGMDLVMRYTGMGDESFPNMHSRYTRSPSTAFPQGMHTQQVYGHSHMALRDQHVGYQDRMGAALPGTNLWSPRSSEYISYPSPLGQLTPVAHTIHGRATTSAMDRYAPRLDDMSPARPGLDVIHAYHLLDPRPRPQPGFSGFAPGPCRPYSYPNSGGWLNE